VTPFKCQNDNSAQAMATFFLHHFQFGSQLGSHNSLIVNTDLKKRQCYFT